MNDYDTITVDTCYCTSVHIRSTYCGLWVMMMSPRVQQLWQIHHLVGMLPMGEAGHLGDGIWETSVFLSMLLWTQNCSKKLSVKTNWESIQQVKEKNKHNLIVLPTFLFCQRRTGDSTSTVYSPPFLKIKSKILKMKDIFPQARFAGTNLPLMFLPKTSEKFSTFANYCKLPRSKRSKSREKNLCRWWSHFY